MKFLGIVFFTALVFFMQCEKPVSDARNTMAANAGNAAPRRAPTAQNVTNMNEIFSSNGTKDGIEYRISGRLQKKGKYEGLDYPNDNVVIDYELKNTGAKNFIVFDRGHSSDNGALVYVEPQADGTVELSLKAFTEPSDKNCPARFVAVTPRGSWLKAGQKIRDKVYLEMPLKRKTPFDDCTPVAEVAPNAAKVKFCLGFQEVKDAGLKVDDNGNITPSPDIRDQQLLCTEIGEIK